MYGTINITGSTPGHGSKPAAHETVLTRGRFCFSRTGCGNFVSTNKEVDMSETKFGVLASLCYMLAFVSAAGAVIFTVSGQTSNLRMDTGLFATAAIALAVWGFVFHAFHTSTLRRDALLTEIRDLLAVRKSTASSNPAPAAEGAP